MQRVNKTLSYKGSEKWITHTEAYPHILDLLSELKLVWDHHSNVIHKATFPVMQLEFIHSQYIDISGYAEKKHFVF